MPEKLPLMQFDNLSPQDFLTSYWQQQWLFCPGGVADFESPVSADELAGLALEEDVESRVVTCDGDSYALMHGPFSEAFFAREPALPWTLLVQAVDLWVPQAARLFDHFDFLPRWRMDDIMLSFATPGGGVGPHFDHYDVFLVQAEGSRTWQIGQWCTGDNPLQPATDLKLLADFDTHAEVTASPGDVLYIPPGLAHWGVADTNSLTYSVGFRAPTLAELLDDLAMRAWDSEHSTHYRDPELSTNMARTEIDPAFINQAKNLLRKVMEDEAALADWFARYVTSPKYPDLLDQTGERRHARINGRTYINGEVDGELEA